MSISSNIAEGASRVSAKERRRFYEIACSYLVEVDTQLEKAINLKYVKKDHNPGLEDTMNHLFAMLSNLIKETK